MNDMSPKSDTQDIVVEEVFPHAPETIWKALTSGALIARWLMEPVGFEPVIGNRFTFRTTPAGQWDGTIHCEVLEATPNRRFAYSWKGGHASNDGYGSWLETVVTWALEPTEAGTRVTLIHAGFEMPRNETAYRNMSGGWKKVVPRLGAIADDLN
ncbi:SRPBCC family protein [Pseudaminobacter soli (ex Li et al. 2025)]|uniref:ATPase n=1 Tax=Pseudaminobacter soli (ex Li et al. 2025) TaxID=1295366 RepID=A0A2P7SFE7_9HYPH|nr:SRPBCC domain-containing protein [Mesorhizobium soli]PSJ61208.1 ATPase [Mesorhizobium soli]